MDIPEKRIHIEKLPDTLCNDAAKLYGTGAKSLDGIITYVRHYMTNYDDIRKKTRMDNDELDQFRDTVNYLIERALLSWHHRRRRQGYQGLAALRNSKWLLTDDYKNAGFPPYRRNTEHRRREAVTDKANQG